MVRHSPGEAQHNFVSVVELPFITHLLSTTVPATGTAPVPAPVPSCP